MILSCILCTWRQSLHFTKHGTGTKNVACKQRTFTLLGHLVSLWNIHVFHGSQWLQWKISMILSSPFGVWHWIRDLYFFRVYIHCIYEVSKITINARNGNRVHRFVLCQNHCIWWSRRLCTPLPSFGAVYCFICNRQRVAVILHRMICLVPARVGCAPPLRSRIKQI